MTKTGYLVSGLLVLIAVLIIYWLLPNSEPQLETINSNSEPEEEIRNLENESITQPTESPDDNLSQTESSQQVEDEESVSTESTTNQEGSVETTETPESGSQSESDVSFIAEVSAIDLSQMPLDGAGELTVDADGLTYTVIIPSGETRCPADIDYSGLYDTQVGDMVSLQGEVQGDVVTVCESVDHYFGRQS